MFIIKCLTVDFKFLIYIFVLPNMRQTLLTIKKYFYYEQISTC